METRKIYFTLSFSTSNSYMYDLVITFIVLSL